MVRFCGFIWTWWLCSFKLLCRRVEKKNLKSWHFFALQWRFELTAAMATEKPAWQYPDLWYWSTVSLSKSTSKIREPWHCYSTREKHAHTCTQTKAYTPKYKTIRSIKNSKKTPQKISITANRNFLQQWTQKSSSSFNIQSSWEMFCKA